MTNAWIFLLPDEAFAKAGHHQKKLERKSSLCPTTWICKAFTVVVIMLGIVGLVTWSLHAYHADKVMKLEVYSYSNNSYSRTKTIRNGEISVSVVTSPPRGFVMKKTKPTLAAKKKRYLATTPPPATTGSKMRSTAPPPNVFENIFQHMEKGWKVLEGK